MPGVGEEEGMMDNEKRVKITKIVIDYLHGQVSLPVSFYDEHGALNGNVSLCEDLLFDSLDCTNAKMDFEEEFGVEMSEADWNAVMCMDHLYALVEGRKPSLPISTSRWYADNAQM